jgi:hypothetical protein
MIRCAAELPAGTSCQTVMVSLNPVKVAILLAPVIIAQKALSPAGATGCRYDV